MLIDQDLYRIIETLTQIIGFGAETDPRALLPGAKNIAAARERARKAGRCIVCRKRRARLNKTTCKMCNEAAKARVQKSRKPKKTAEATSLRS